MPSLRAFVFLSLLMALPAAPVLAAPPSSNLAEEARAIDAELVGCGTRHSLSSWTDPKRGIGCGRDVVVRRLNEIAARNGGRARGGLRKQGRRGARPADARARTAGTATGPRGAAPPPRRTARIRPGPHGS